MTAHVTSRPVAYEGMRTPWGRADVVRVYTEHIAFVGTSGHGGFKVSRARNAKIPAAARAAGGWYEEDCAWAIPFIAFANEIVACPIYVANPAKFEADKAQALSTLVNWLPEEYTALTGITPPTEVSRVLRERANRAQALALGAFMVRSALGNSAIGSVDVILERADASVPERTGSTITIRMSSTDYDALRYVTIPVAFPYLTPETVQLYPRID